MPLTLIVPAKASLQQAALALLYCALPAGQREQQLADTLAAVRRNEMSLENLVTALDGDQVVGTVLAVLRPGGAAFLWPPAVRAGAQVEEVATALLTSIASRVDAQGAQFTQCLVEPEDTATRATLERGGIPYATDLVLLSRPLLRDSAPPLPSDLSFESYSASLHPTFAYLVERTYVGTLDCPVLARVRGGEDSLTAHRATGQFVPSAWRLYRQGGRDVGVLLLAEHPDRDTWEVAYLGVVPEARGQGLGRALLQDGLAYAAASGRSTIEIAVDAANLPALRLYHALEFTDVKRFAVHLRVRP
jgi:ribosomal protein S18 acetylase RimI-like enzyme